MPQPEEAHYDEYVVEDRDASSGEARFLGTLGGAGGRLSAFYDPDESTVFHGRVDEERERIVPQSGSERDVEESLGETLETIGEDLGWESLSEFAEEHLEADENVDG